MRKDVEEIIWAAGFFDGEGCISLQKRLNGNTHVRLAIKQTDRCVLDRFLHAVGGGRVLGPYQHDHGPHRKNCKPIFQYYLSKKEEVEGALEALLPYLSEPKAAAARNAISLLPDDPAARVRNARGQFV